MKTICKLLRVHQGICKVPLYVILVMVVKVVFLASPVTVALVSKIREVMVVTMAIHHVTKDVQ
jgi:hypothetical protein